jgi:cytochrome c553
VVTDSMQERDEACTACHGSSTQASTDGFSPRIAGKPAGYLFNQLVSFRDGRRAYPPMVYLVQYMSDDYLREMAAYFAGLDLPYPPPEAVSLAPETLARVRAIIERGDAPPAACPHAWIATVRASPAPSRPFRVFSDCPGITWPSNSAPGARVDCARFHRIAWPRSRAGSRPRTCPVLAAWLASQPVPSAMKPRPRRARPLPLQCGSVTAAMR